MCVWYLLFHYWQPAGRGKLRVQPVIPRPLASPNARKRPYWERASLAFPTALRQLGCRATAANGSSKRWCSVAERVKALAYCWGQLVPTDEFEHRIHGLIVALVSNGNVLPSLMTSYTIRKCCLFFQGYSENNRFNGLPVHYWIKIHGSYTFRLRSLAHALHSGWRKEADSTLIMLFIFLLLNMNSK